MNRRPWPIVLIAILQLLSPFFYVATAAIFYQLSMGETMKEIVALTPDLRKIEIFILPILLGGLILFTRKSGYYFVIVGTVYLIVRGVAEFIASNNTDPVFPIVLSNFLCLIVIATLLRPQTRSIYFNPRLRWWETSPRYIIQFPASVTRVGGKPMKATFQNIAAGGAGIETVETGFLKEEIITLEFQHEGEIFQLKSKIVWERRATNGNQFLGLQWADDNKSGEFSKIRRLIRNLKAKKTKTTRAIEPRFAEVKDWFTKIAG
jgi:uncharacterized membrane protein (UPF0136 family)